MRIYCIIYLFFLPLILSSNDIITKINTTITTFLSYTEIYKDSLEYLKKIANESETFGKQSAEIGSFLAESLDQNLQLKDESIQNFQYFIQSIRNALSKTYVNRGVIGSWISDGTESLKEYTTNVERPLSAFSFFFTDLLLDNATSLKPYATNFSKHCKDTDAVMDVSLKTLAPKLTRKRIQVGNESSDNHSRKKLAKDIKSDLSGSKATDSPFSSPLSSSSFTSCTSDTEEEMAKVEVWPPPAYNGKVRFEVWQIQLELYMTAMNIKDEKKASCLLQNIGLDMLEKLIDWSYPKTVTTLTYEEILTLITNHCSSATNLFALRVKLFNEKQLLGQCAMKDMKPQEYGVLAILRGLQSDEIRSYLMNPANDIKDIEKTRQLAVSFQQSKDAATEIKAEIKDKPFAMNAVGSGNVCGYCGGTHLQGHDNCPAATATCNRCDKKGHYAKVCRSKNEIQPGYGPSHQHRRHHNRQNWIQDTPDTDASVQQNGFYAHRQQNVTADIPGNFSLDVLSLQAEPHMDIPPPIIINAKVNGYPVSFQHDSGAATTVVSKEVWNKLGRPKLQRTCINLRSYNQKINVLGICRVSAKIQGQIKQSWLVVAKEGDSLLGRNWMKEFNLKAESKLHHYCNQVESADKLQEILDEHSNVFKKDYCSRKAKLQGRHLNLVHVPMQGKEDKPQKLFSINSRVSGHSEGVRDTNSRPRVSVKSAKDKGDIHPSSSSHKPKSKKKRKCERLSSTYDTVSDQENMDLSGTPSLSYRHLRGRSTVDKCKDEFVSGVKQAKVRYSNVHRPVTKTKTVVVKSPPSQYELVIKQKLRDCKQDFKDLNKLYEAIPDKLENASKELRASTDDIAKLICGRKDIPDEVKKNLEYIQAQISNVIQLYEDIPRRKKAIKNKSFELREELRLYCDNHKLAEYDLDLNYDE